MAVTVSTTSSHDSTSDTVDSLPKLTPVGQRLEHIIKYSLDRFQFRNAIFLAERLYYHTRGAGHTTEEQEYAQYLLATCQYRQGQPELAWASLDGCTSIRNRYLFAQCCLDLRRYAECNGVLEWLLQETLPTCSATDIMAGKNVPRSGDPDKASVLNLLGRTARAQQRHKLAIKYFTQALEVNPFLWEALENLSELGSAPDPNSMFTEFDATIANVFAPRPVPVIQRIKPVIPNPPTPPIPKHEDLQNENIADTIEASYNQSCIPAHDLIKPRQGFLPTIDTNSMAVLAQISEGNGIDKPNTLLRRGTAGHMKRSFERTKSSSALQARSSSSGTGTKRGLDRYATFSNLQSSQRASTTNTTSNAVLEEPVGSVAPPAVSKAELQEELEALRIVADTFKILARAYGLFSQNKFNESIMEYESLPYEHLASGWVQCQLAKNKFEMTDYTTAAQYFQRARELEPSIHRDMEIYSTCLWHLKQEMKLSALGKELKDSNHHSPQAWCALGNAYSLRNENDQAIKCFQRAIQLDDRFAYAHTLSGHEYKGLDEYDKALTEYRTALSIDDRHYPAWCGMGDVYIKVGKNDLALIHYKEAHRLNPSNTVVIFLVGIVQERMNRTTEALRSFEEAIHLQPGHAMARFEKAKVQKEMGQYTEALKELDVVHKIAPTEPRVFMLQGEILLEMGDKKEALKKLTWALDLDSKSSHAIRDLIDKVNQDSDAEEQPYDIQHDSDG
ncbi:anaphase-promoting complex subunit cdc27 [Linnemannia gamsii]|uniref:Anaphase-promoting complex subunit cdc27 n=1 Tax=Linnemannia gamsii TaxID=64522 RepID=A0A9P6RD91_9FUNG|nr:anaphase-promoting complex subunit cdc27 [Linnemannia gamsii]